jgi:hypothetical protein
VLPNLARKNDVDRVGGQKNWTSVGMQWPPSFRHWIASDWPRLTSASRSLTSCPMIGLMPAQWLLTLASCELSQPWKRCVLSSAEAILAEVPAPGPRHYRDIRRRHLITGMWFCIRQFPELDGRHSQMQALVSNGSNSSPRHHNSTSRYLPWPSDVTPRLILLIQAMTLPRERKQGPGKQPSERQELELPPRCPIAIRRSFLIARPIPNP